LVRKYLFGVAEATASDRGGAAHGIAPLPPRPSFAAVRIHRHAYAAAQCCSICRNTAKNSCGLAEPRTVALKLPELISATCAPAIFRVCRLDEQ